MKTVTPEQFGAKADSVTNDAVAVWAAVDSLKDGDTLEFQPHKKYYIAPINDESEYNFISSGPIISKNYNQRFSAFDLNGLKNVTIKGKDTTILIERPLFYCNINYTENVTLEGLIFDYKVRPFAKAELIELQTETNSAIMQMDRSLCISELTDVYGFGVLQRPDGRYHMFMDSIEPKDEENKIYKVNFSNDECTVSRLPMLKTHTLIAPLPGFAHRIERAFSITWNTNFSMIDCKVYSMARFGFALFRNQGTVRFENLQIRKAPDETVNIVGWRDCFHVKENHAKFIWDHCYAEYCYDDIFNISASTLNVAKVYNEADLDLEWRETNGVYSGAKVGDSFSFFDYKTGKDYGTHILKEIVCQEENHNRFRFETPVIGIKAGPDSIVHDDEMVAPGTVIDNCDFRGTFRFRGPIEIKNTHFYNARMWIDWYPSIEGPIPKHIHFINCEIDCDDDENPYFHVAAQKMSQSEEPQYHIEDIIFKNCRVPLKTFEIQPSETEYIKFC